MSLCIVAAGYVGGWAYEVVAFGFVGYGFRIYARLWLEMLLP